MVNKRGCQNIIQKAWSWTIVTIMLRECHVWSFQLKTSEKSSCIANDTKSLICRPCPQFSMLFLVAVRSCWIVCPIPLPCLHRFYILLNFSLVMNTHTIFGAGRYTTNNQFCFRTILMKSYYHPIFDNNLTFVNIASHLVNCISFLCVLLF